MSASQWMASGVQVCEALTDVDAPPPVARHWVVAGNDIDALHVSTAKVWIMDGAEGTYAACDGGILAEGTMTVPNCR